MLRAAQAAADGQPFVAFVQRPVVLGVVAHEPRHVFHRKRVIMLGGALEICTSADSFFQ